MSSKFRHVLSVCVFALFGLLGAMPASAQGTINVRVVSPDGTPVADSVRWILEEDATYRIDPANPPANPMDSAAFQLHKSYMPIAASSAPDSASVFTITGIDETKKYYLSVIPHPRTSGCGAGEVAAGGCYSMSGTPVQFAPGETSVTVEVVVQPQPVPAAQARILVFDDRAPVNNAWDAGEPGLGDFTVFIYDAGGGPLVTDMCGNPLDTVYDGPTCDNVAIFGNGTLVTMNGADAADPAKNPLGLKTGEVLIQNLPPAKYGVRVVGPAGQEWHQTTTIEGTPGIDIWLRAGEPMFAVEFGPTIAHAFFGMVQETDNLPEPAGGSAAYTVSGTVHNLRIARPADPNFVGGEQELGGCWVGLNDITATEALYIGPCNKYGEGEASFEIRGVPDGTYGLVVWDEYLLNLISFFTVTVDGANVDLDAAPAPLVNVPRWFGTQEHFVFNDLNENGIRDIVNGELEPGIPEQAINLRFRDGSIFAASATDNDGYLPLEEVFPFFSWLVAEVDFARFDATGVRVTVDDGGSIPVTGDPDDPLDPANGVRNPQDQSTAAGLQPQRVESRYAATCDAADPETCEVVDGPPLTEGYNIFAGTNFKFEWGKRGYSAGENGGVSGVVYYQTTRAENDPRFAAPEPWEPGVPRVPMFLYEADADGVIQDQGGDGIQLADIDHYPFCWSDAEFVAANADLCPGGMVMGSEDIERSGSDGIWDSGDAITFGATDSWDDSVPEGCVGDTLAAENAGPFADLNGRCYDGLRNFSQVRPAVFDGGFGLGAPWDGTTNFLTPGVYVVEAAAPPGYEHQDELSKNVDFGDTFMPQALPPVCVGDPAHTGNQQPANVVPSGADLELFGGVPVDERYTGDRPFCNMKMIQVKDGLNAAVDFFVYSEVPISGHIQGNVFNDLANATDPLSPTFGEKLPAANIPISMRDFAGNEINRLYTDANGRYNGLVPSTTTINAPMPTGVSPNMLQTCLNPRTMKNPAHMTDASQPAEIPDPNFDPRLSPVCYTLNFNPGQTTYLDTPILPAGAFVNTPSWQLDCEYPSGTPVIAYATADGLVGGPIVSAVQETTLSIYSVGVVDVADPTLPFPAVTTRDYGFGDGGGNSRVLLNGDEVAVNSWDSGVIEVRIPAGSSTGQLEVIRANGTRTVHGLTLTVMANPADALLVPAAFPTIQAAIDAASAGDVVLVEPGVYTESLFITKPIQLQGYGAGATTILADTSRDFGNTVWREQANIRANCPANEADRIGLLPGQPNNVSGNGDCGRIPGSGLLSTDENAAVFVAPMPGVFGANDSRIDGFTITGANFSAGIAVNGYAHNLQISNNVVENNSGVAAGGIRLGQADLLDANGNVVYADNVNVAIEHNYISRNSSTFLDGAGIGLYTGSDNYRVSNNFICGNYSQGDGAGIAHYGRSEGGLISQNQILFNEAFDQTAAAQGGGGGGIFVGGFQQGAAAEVRVTPGSGSVKIVENIIHGNHAGSHDGGGILLRSVNGQDLLINAPEDADRVEIMGNMITNNVSALAGGAVALQDSINVAVVHNTIANNDSTATAAGAFVDPNATAGLPAGVATHAHGSHLNDLGIPGIGEFSSPDLDNNIIFGNRSMHWESAAGLIVDRFWDLGVLGTAGSFDASGNILTDEDPDNAQYAGDPSIPADNKLLSIGDEADLLATPYVNGSSGAMNLNIAPALFDQPLLATTAQDEGGNFIIVAYGPLSLERTAPTEPLPGDYHLEAGSFAIDRSDLNNMLGMAELFDDIDGDPRPVFTAVALEPDTGADEVAASEPLDPLPPRIISSPTMPVLNNSAYAYQLVAIDANASTTLYYYVQRCNGNFQNCRLNMNQGESMSAAGLFTWNTQSQTRRYRFTVCDTDIGAPPTANGSTPPANSCDWQDATLNPYSSNRPIANDDQINVNVVGQFMLPAPGVLANDSAGRGDNRFETIVPINVDTANLTANTGGTATVSSNGALSFYAPDSWVGQTSFTYQVTDGVFATPSQPATVTLRRRASVISAVLTQDSATGSGTLHIDGVSVPRNGHLRVDRVPAAGGAPEYLGRTSGNNDLQDGVWTIDIPGVTLATGDTLQIRRNNTANVWLTGVVAQVLYTNGTTGTSVFVQCPGDDNGDGIYDDAERAAHPDINCKHLTAGDGFIKLADGNELYTFGFSDADGIAPADAIAEGLLDANFPAPTIELDQGEEFYLTLTNVGTIMRPDLFDPHTVHFHGFPNASAVFDGVPESSISINAGFSLTYYYNIVDAGTFMYHCHVEAAEHMQMGMLGNLYVNPAQNGLSVGGFTEFAYNDGDGSTGYDRDFAIQIGGMDRNYHDEHLLVQPLPFAYMDDDYPMLNGRGYPDTINQNPLEPVAGGNKAESGVVSANESSQKESSYITAVQGERILLRISNLNVTQFYTLATSGLPMEVVGKGAHILRGPNENVDLYYQTNSITLGGGEAVDILIDTSQVAAGTYVLYSTNLNELSNGPEDFGGMMTEIVITAP